MLLFRGQFKPNSLIFYGNRIENVGHGSICSDILKLIAYLISNSTKDNARFPYECVNLNICCRWFPSSKSLTYLYKWNTKTFHIIPQPFRNFTWELTLLLRYRFPYFCCFILEKPKATWKLNFRSPMKFDTFNHLRKWDPFLSGFQSRDSKLSKSFLYEIDLLFRKKFWDVNFDELIFTLPENVLNF